MKVKATSTGTPPISGAEAFARLIWAAMGKKPALQVVTTKPRQLSEWADMSDDQKDEVIKPIAWDRMEWCYLELTPKNESERGEPR